MKLLKFFSLFLYLFVIAPIFILQKLKISFLRTKHNKIDKSFWKNEK